MAFKLTEIEKEKPMRLIRKDLCNFQDMVIKTILVSTITDDNYTVFVHHYRDMKLSRVIIKYSLSEQVVNPINCDIRFSENKSCFK